MRHLATVALLTSVGLTAACGSTVQYAGTTPLSGATGDGLTATSGAPAADTTTGGGGAGSTPAGPDAGGSGGGVVIGPSMGSTPGVTSAEGSGTTGAQGAGPLTGPGFTASTIKIGIATSSDYNTFASSTGLKGVGFDGDPKNWYAAVAGDINRHGGILGRKVELVAHDFNTEQTLTNPAAANQGACADWVQDHHVFAVVGPPVVEDTLLSCMRAAKTPIVQIGGGLDYPLHYAESYAKNPLYFNLDQIDGDRFDKVAIARLVARHYFDPWNTRTGSPGTAATPMRFGIVSFDDHDGALQLASLEKQLKAHGLTATSTVACPRSLSDKIACEQSAVLKFASSNITHVMNSDSTFMNAASSQGYYPRHFLPIEPALFAANVPAKELSGAMGEGYIPFLDTPADKYPGDPSPATGACTRLMKAAGQASTDPTTVMTQLSICDGFFFLRSALRAAGALGAEALRSGLESLGSKTPSALTYETFLGPHNHASAGAVRDLLYDAGIQNFVYTSRTDHRAA